MTSRWLVATAVLGGLIAAVALGFFSAVFAGIWLYSGDYGSVNPFFRIFLVLFTLLTVPAGVLLARKGSPQRRACAVGLLIGWAAIDILVGMTFPTL